MPSFRDLGSRRLRRNAALALSALGLIGFLYLFVVFVAVTMAANDSRSARATGEAIVVLGAAQYDGRPSPVLEQRLRTALELWEGGAAPVIVTTGANQPGDTFTEGFAGFRYLREAGVAEDRIVVIVDGGDTYESLLATANQLTAAASIVIVTDPYHARRSAEVAAAVGLDATVVAASDDSGLRRRLRETAAVAIGRIIGYRRLSSLR